ncbi:YqeG family HAD IIIA-type phosphatase [Sporolactobacillus sp. THM7-7]|nr:YqeG family HAD IIIA-type phosphatase [Sporolactobacillus sp. THM7-7]
MLKKFLPEEHVNSILDIQPEMLKNRGIKGIITDLDNTLVAWNEANMTPELAKWFAALQKAGIAVMILSNNKKKRVERFSAEANIPFIFRARKPLPHAFKRAMKKMNLTKDELVVIGDQIMTDVWGGNQIGAHTILVAPITSTDGWMTRFNRRLEHLVLSKMRQKGWVTWEDSR